MKMPSFSELDEEQLRVYQGAPPDGSVLVVGPPGTGKTIMAFHRARTLKELGRSPQVIMYNSVLRSFSSTGHDTAEDVDVDTMHKWLDKWFRTMRAGRPPQTAPWVTDWPAVGAKVQEVLRNSGARTVNWGHLIVDEGQDFPKEMYSVLSFLTRAHNWNGVAPAITVFADENQRLSEKHNSCTADLQSAMSLSAGNRLYRLSRNYRNTKQVAEFASHFYCGLSTGRPDVPRKKGPLPIVHFVKDVSEVAVTIADYVIDAPPQEIGVICCRDRDRRRVFGVLQDKLGDSDEIEVQTFKSGDPEYGRAQDLTFDEKGCVTVLNYQSVKGLEFDTVFIVDPFLATPPAGAGVQQFKMNLYVMCSRARTNLRLLFVTSRENVLPHLPPPGTFKVAQ